MKNELTIGDFKSSYFKIIDNEDEVQGKIYLNEDEAKLIAAQTTGRVMKISKRTLHTMEFERVY